MMPTGIVSFTSDGRGNCRRLPSARSVRVRQRRRDWPIGSSSRSATSKGSLGGYHITRLEHSLQAATRARLDGADVNWVVAALPARHR